MTRNKKAEKVKWKTVSLPGGLADDVQELIDGSGYWPGLGAFVREAVLDKIKKERELLKELRDERREPKVGAC